MIKLALPSLKRLILAAGRTNPAASLSPRLYSLQNPFPTFPPIICKLLTSPSVHLLVHRLFSVLLSSAFPRTFLTTLLMIINLHTLYTLKL